MEVGIEVKSWVTEGQIYQPITWKEPETRNHLAPDKYVIFYGTDASLPRQQFNDTTANATLSFVISLPLPSEAVTYYIWVAGRTGGREGPLSEVFQLNYAGMYIVTALNVYTITFSCAHIT